MNPPIEFLMNSIDRLLLAVMETRDGMKKFVKGDSIEGLGDFEAINATALDAEKRGYVKRREKQAARATSVDCIWVQIASKGRLYLRGRDFRTPAC